MPENDTGRAYHSLALRAIVSAQKRGESLGITSVCSASPWVIEATLQHAQETGEPVLIESTCNQVNQFGGYTGWTPAQFAVYLRNMAQKQGYPLQKIIIGGDHLGPSPWQDEPAAVAMEKARTLVRDYVLAGYNKIHLDASMKCADDDPERPLDITRSAERAAELALSAEAAAAERADGGGSPCYVIGTEVPAPGGIQDQEETLAVTRTADLAETIEATRRAFLRQGLESAWRQVIAVVVQPGVEYGDASLFEYDRARAADLARFIDNYDQLIYEAHSTDYQTAGALRHLVEDHFAILKVGPALTFAYREGVFALAAIEEELLAGKQSPKPSRVREVLDEAMLANPIYWRNYYPENSKLARKYSYSDRSRYYWPAPQVGAALFQMLQNLSGQPLPLTLLSQFLPQQYQRIRDQMLFNSPRAILLDKVRHVLADYSFACGYQKADLYRSGGAPGGLSGKRPFG